MGQDKIRKKVREVLHEMMQQMHPAYPINGRDNMFPGIEGDEIVRLPEDIDLNQKYLVNWEGISDNNDLYSFPLEEFKKGLHVEKAKNNIFNILDIAEIVINNLEDNPRFYSNLGV